MDNTSQPAPQQVPNPSPSSNVTFPTADPVNTDTGKPSGIVNFIKNKAGIIVLVILVIIVAIGGFYAYNNIYFAPEKVLERTLAKMREVTSFGIDGKIIQSNALTANITGSVDYKDKDNPKSEFSLDIQNGPTSFLSGKVRVLDHNSYIYLDNIDGLETDLSSGDSQGFLSFLTGNWIKIDEGELQSYGYDGTAIESTTFDPNKVVSLFEGNNPIRITSQMPTEQIDGQDMFKYSFDLDKEKLKMFLTEFQKFIYGENSDSVTEASIEDAVNKMELAGGQIWIGKSDYYLHKIAFMLTIAGESESTSYDIDLEMKDINSDVNIEVPEGARTVKSILSELLASPTPEPNQAN